MNVGDSSFKYEQNDPVYHRQKRLICHGAEIKRNPKTTNPGPLNPAKQLIVDEEAQNPNPKRKWEKGNKRKGTPKTKRGIAKVPLSSAIQHPERCV